MDLKKVLDQTVRELKREVNKKVLKVPEIEQKVLEATSNEPWGPHGTLMADIAQATRNFNEYQMIMGILWKRLNDTGKNWRHVYKALTVLEFLVANGAERIVDDFSEHAYQVQTLVDFQYIEPSGKDQGINVRKKAQTLVTLVNDKEKIREVRHKAATNRDKYRGVSSTGSIHKSSSYSSTGGGYSGDQDEEQFGSNSRYGGRDDDKYGAGRDRDGDRYRGEDRFGRDGHPSRDDEYKSDRERNNDYSFGQKGDGHSYKYSGDRHDGADKDQFHDDDDHVRYHNTGGRMKSEYSPDNRAEPHISKAQVGTPPSYEDTVLGHESVHGRPDNSRDGGGSFALSQAGTSAQWAGSPAKNVSAEALNKTNRGSFPTNVEDLDDFDPRGRSGRPAAPTPLDDHILGQTLFGTNTNLSSTGAFAKSITGVEDLFSDATFLAGSASAPTSSTPSSALEALPAYPAQTSNKHAGGDPFTVTGGSSISGAVDIFAFPSQDMIASASAGMSVTSVGLQGGPTVFSNSSEPSSYAGAKLFAGPGFTAGGSSEGGLQTGSTISTQQLPSVHGVAAASQPTGGKKSFERKGLWADTLSTGLVDLNIERPKNNPLAELGIELGSSSTFSDRRKDDRSLLASMGKAMGSGSGLGLSAASNLVPPHRPLGMSGTGISVGGGIVPGYSFSMGMSMGVHGLVMPSGLDAGYPMGQGFGTGSIGSNPSMGNGSGLPMAHGMRVGYGTGYTDQQR